MKFKKLNENLPCFEQEILLVKKESTNVEGSFYMDVNNVELVKQFDNSLEFAKLIDGHHSDKLVIKSSDYGYYKWMDYYEFVNLVSD